MINRLKHLFLFFIFFAFFIFLSVNNAHASDLSAPEIIEIKQDSVLNFSKPLVIGEVRKGMEVFIYIDGEPVGLADVNVNGNKTNNFYFRAEELEEGRHMIRVQARDRETLELSSFSREIIFKIKTPSLPTPALIEPNKSSVIFERKPLITGLTKSGTRVHIYIDGALSGQTKVLKHKSGTADFFYKPSSDLNIGRHFVELAAEDEAGNISRKSNGAEFNIEYPLPAPVLKKYYISQGNKLTIAGVALNDLEINVFIDHKLDGKFMVKNHLSGTASFSYETAGVLAGGGHAVYATAIDSRGKESRPSNILWPNIMQAKQAAKPKITPIAAEEKLEPVNENTKTLEHENTKDEDIEVENKNSEAAIIDPEKITGEKIEDIDDFSKKIFDTPQDEKIIEEIEVKKEPDASGKIEEAIDQEKKPETEETGSVDENKEKQSRMDWSLLIFFLFLLAVIGWIFWVNKALIKEKQDKKDNYKDNPPDDKNNIQSDLDI